MVESKNGNGGSLETPPSTKPYLLRAIYEWCVDSGFTPQILVDTRSEEVEVPSHYIQDNRIILNIHPQSVRDFELGNEYLLFSARFSGKPFAITVPIDSVLAVYSRENGQGIVFQNETENSDSESDSGLVEQQPPESDTKPAPDKPGSKSSNHLKLIK